MNQIKAAAIYYVKRNIKLKDFIKRVLIVLQFPIVLIAFVYSKFSTKNRNLWLIGETGTDAKDNGSAFYSYLIDNHPEINTMYYISGETAVAARIHRMGKSVVTNSFQHKVAFMSAKYILSTHDGYSIPFVGANWHDFKAVYGWLTPRLQFVFLSHGVSKDDESGNANYQRTRFDYFVTSTEDEYQEFSSSRYGYPSGNVIKTGLSRYDVLLANSDGITQKRNIVFMPTWRYYLADVDDEEFTKSRYFKQIYSLLHDSDLNNLISDNQVEFYFFPPHHEIQKRMKLFDLDETKVVPIDTEASVFSDIVLSSSMMITDFSSVIFDFAFLYKRTAYFQFDLEEYRRGQYKQGYFQYARDGFGPICTTKDVLISEIQNAISDDFKIEKKYAKRIDHTFAWRDGKNCERLFNILVK